MRKWKIFLKCDYFFHCFNSVSSWSWLVAARGDRVDDLSWTNFISHLTDEAFIFKDVRCYKRLLFSVAKTVWKITEIWFFLYFYSFSIPILWAGLNPGLFTFSWTGSFLKLRSLDPGRWCWAEISGDSGTGGCGLRGQRGREPCLLYLCLIEAS